MNIKKTVLVTTALISLSANAVNTNQYERSISEPIDIYKPYLELNESNEAAVSPYVVNGSTAKLSDYPFYARLVLTDGISYMAHTCGGSILSKDYILTAAHCLFDINGVVIEPEEISTIINDTEYYQTGFEKIKTVAEIIVHPDYDANTFSNDIAVLKLRNSITEEFTAINIASPDKIKMYNNLDSMTVVGMGYIDNNQKNPDKLLKGEVDFKNDETCSSLVTSIYGGSFLDEKQICAKSKPAASEANPDLTLNVDACQGDSGGPLNYYDEETSSYKQAGIVSYGAASGCADDNAPTVYTEVTGYAEWIESKTGVKQDVDSDTDGDDDNGGGGLIDEGIGIGNGGDSGGSLGFMSMFGLFGLMLFRRKKSN